MALTFRSNGSSSTNIIQASWFNDFYNLFTGVMSDQPVLINNGVMLKAVSNSPTAPTLALAAGTSLGIGSYTYAVSLGETNNGQTTIGQSVTGATASITTTSGNQVVSLTSIPTGPAGTTSRYIYRSKVGTTTPLYLVTQLNDNTTTSFTDTIPDASLGAQAPTHGSFGGYLMVLGSGGSLKAAIYNDGAISFDAGGITSNGSGQLSLAGPGGSTTGTISGSFSWNYPIWGPGLKITLISLNNFQSANAITISLPSVYTGPFLALSAYSGSGNWTPYKAGVGQNSVLFTTLGSSGGGTTSTQPNVESASYGVVEVAGIDSIRFSNSTTPAANGSILLLGV